MGTQINRSIVIDAKVKTTLEGMNEVVSKLNQGLRDGTTKIDLTKGVGSSLSKNLDKFKDEYSRFSKFIEGGKIEFADAKDAVKSGKTLIKTYREMKRIVGDFNDLTVFDAKKLFPDAFDSRVNELLGGLDKLSSAMVKLDSKQLDLSTAKTEMKELRDRAEELETIMQKGITLKIEADKTQADLDTIEQEIEAIRKKASDGITLKINTAKKEAGDAKTKKDEILAARTARGFNEDDFAGSRTGSTKFKGKTMAQWTAEGSKKGATEATIAEVAAAQEAIRLYEREKNALADLSAIITDREKQAKQLSDTLAKLGTMKLPEAVAAAGGTPEEITEATTAIELQKDAIEANTAAQSKYKVAATQAGKAKKEFDGVTAAIDAQQAKIDKLTLEIGEMKKEVSTEALEKAFSSAGVEGFTAEMLKSKEGIQELRDKLNELDDKKLKLLKQDLQDMGFSADQAEGYVEQLRGGLRGVEADADGIKRAASEMDNLKNQVLQFFSLTNSVQLFKRAVTSALNTVKELDATMTEAAVVTEFDISDMWSKLPQYSKEAQKLGVSINGMYQATTLYYQQGLKSNEAMQLGIETMKMGKIAAMDSTEATKAMTAALRGFNMELNETSATRVNDVYSQLAAVTAADTSQIATAMEKTASIAASANMEFETTAALLAQIIETTQEAPETAGTAMKTIIARFSEVKSLREQGLTSGKDSEGEDLDVNKIQTALRTVGISMNGFFEGTEGLDSILLKLAEKWGSLDFETQRYIATMAAGSRQQSRFIAMMSDYGRTQELVNKANNSAGASQDQFNKTLDSMESKLQKLENAWKQFLMGLTNNEILKFGVDTLTFIIEGINKMIDSISGGNGLIKSITSLVAVVGSLKLGKPLLEKGMGWIGQSMGISGQGDGSFKETVTESRDESNNVVRTIVREPYKQGEASGAQAGNGFVAGFKRAITAGKTGENVLESFFTTGPATEVNGKNIQPTKGVGGALKKKQDKRIQKKHEGASKRKIMSQDSSDATKRKDFLEDINSKNVDMSSENYKQVVQAYDEVYKKTGDMGEAMDAANAKTKELGGTLLSSAQEAAVASEQTNGLALNMGALGGATMGIGAALGGLSAIFEAIGLEEAAEATSILAATFMGLGTVMSTLSTIAPMLGMSFTTAGVQITTAGVTSQIAWWWVFLIIAAVALLVVGVIALAKAAKEASDEAQFEKLNEQIEEMSQLADEAKQKLDDIASTKEELDKLGGSFDNLTKGSREWKKALVENNQKVLELLNTYPELSEWISKGLNGELIIEEQGWEELQNKELEKYTTAVNTQAALSSQKDRKKLEMDQETKLAEVLAETYTKTYYGNLSEAEQEYYKKQQMQVYKTQMSDAEVGGYEDSTEKLWTGGLTFEQFSSFSALASENGLSMVANDSKEQFAEIFKQEFGEELYNSNFEAVWAQMQKMGSAFDELAASADAVKQAELARVDAVASQVAQTSDIVQSSREFGAVAEEMSAQAFEDYSSKVQAKAQKNMTADGKNATEDAIKKYAESNGLTAEQVKAKIKSGEISKESVANAVATQEVDKELKLAMENTVKIMERIAGGKSKNEINQLKGLMTDRGMGMGISGVANMNGMNQADVTNYLRTQGFTEQDAMDMGYTKIENGKTVADFDAFAKAMTENAIAAAQGLNAAFEGEGSLAIGDKLKGTIHGFDETLRGLGSQVGLTVDQAKNLSESLAKVSATGGDVTELSTSFSQMLTGVSQDNIEQAQNLIASTDWTQQESIDSTVQALEALGANIDDNLVKKIYKASNAVKKLDLEELENKLEKLQSAMDMVENKNQNLSKSYSKEERDAAVSAGANEDNFVRIAFDEYVYMGDTNQLLEDIKQNTQDILKEMGQDIDKAVEVGQNYHEVVSSNKTYEVGAGNSTFTGKQMSASELIESLVDGSYDTIYGESEHNVERGTLEELVRDLNLFEGEDLAKYNEAQLAEAVISNYKNYYGLGGQIWRENENKQNSFYNEQASIAYAQGAGSIDFIDQERVNKINKLNEAEVIEETRVGGNLEAMIGAGFSYQGENEFGEKMYSRETQTLEVVKDAANGQGKYDTDTQKQAAKSLGMENIDQATSEEVTKWLQDYYRDSLLVEESLDAVIASQAGLSTAVEVTTSQIASQDKTLSKDSLAMKNLAIAAHKANLNMDKLNEVIVDQADNLKIGDKNNAQYRQALEKTANAAKDVFGKNITTDFVDQNRELFAQLSEGGEVAEQAYGQIAKKYGEMTLLQETGFTEGSDKAKQAAQIINEAFNNIKPGESMDLSEYYAKLMAIEGMTEEAAKNTMNAWGFSVSTSTEKAWMKGGIISKTKPEDMTGWQEFDMLVGTKESAVGTGASAPKGSGGGSKYENPYDKFYNTYEKINSLLREREKLERRYDKLLQNRSKSSKDLIEASKQELANLEEQRKKQEYLQNGKLGEINALMSKNSKYSKYVTGFDESTGTISINWEAIDKIKSTSTGEKVDEYISKLEGLRDQWQEAQDALDEIEDATNEIRERGQEDYKNFEQRVKDALINERQKEIDALSEINDSINDTNSRLLDSMQRQIDEYRQSRDNEKTEQELEDKQRRLAYLQQDTSGANALEILNLQKEIEEGQESYTDQLIDQKVSELQRQNDEAAEQRERQIELMQAQLDYYTESDVWQDVYRIIDDVKNGNSAFAVQLLKEAEGYDEMSATQQRDWDESTNTEMNSGMASFELSRASEGEPVSFTNASGQTLSGTADSSGNFTIGESIYRNVVRDHRGNWSTTETSDQASANWQEENPQYSGSGNIASLPSTGKLNAANVKKLQTGLNELKEHGKLSGYDTLSVDGSYGPKTKAAVRILQAAIGTTADGDWGKNSRKKFLESSLKEYKTGGLADFTGPAWLDGTKSKPEYILNADQTRAFFTLVDVLSGLQTKGSQTTQNSGDNSFDIDINVESIGNDYDVEQLANKVKNLINEDARYRNNNIVSTMR